MKVLTLSPHQSHGSHVINTALLLHVHTVNVTQATTLSHLEYAVITRVPTILLTEKSSTFQDPQNVFLGLCRSPATDKQQLLTLYIQCDSTIHHKTFITSYKESVRLAHSRKTSYIYLHMVFYT